VYGLNWAAKVGFVYEAAVGVAASGTASKLLRSNQKRRTDLLIERRLTMLLLIIILILLFGGGGGYYGYSRWGAGGGLGILGTVLLIVLVLYLLGAVHV
jgi:hypothetical protein